jgi:hypothetical protein
MMLIIMVASHLTIHAQSRTEEELYQQLMTNGPVSISVSALETVIKSPNEYSAGILYAGCFVAEREKRLEDAGFLLYIARFRGRFDQSMFPPIGTGGNNPMVALAAYHNQLGTVINPEITAQPDVYAKIVERLKLWKPKVSADYNPGWGYAAKKSEKEAEEAVASNRKETLDFMTGLSTLLLDKEYFKAFKTLQDYNLKSDATRPSKEARDEAIQILERIEKEKGINGVAKLSK